MNKLQLIKIALLTALLVEEVRNAKCKSLLDSRLKSLTVYDSEDNNILTIDHTNEPVKLSSGYYVSVKTN